MLKVDDYASFLAREYLSGYLSAGGAAVKVAVVGEASAADRLESALAAETAGSDGLFVSVPAELVRVHMIDQIFFAISQTIAWEDLAAECVRSAYEQASFPVPDGTDLAVARVARHHDGDISELYRSVRRLLERNLFANPVRLRGCGRERARSGQFAARLLRASGRAGWVILFDEVELIGRYSLLQRGRMRQYVRAWINEWDLVRLDPQFRPQTEVVQIDADYSEDSALEEYSEIGRSF